MKVEELAQYGSAPEIPLKVLKQQEKIIFRLLRKEFGLFDYFIIRLNLKKQTGRIYKQFPGQIKKAGKTGENMTRQFVMMASLFFSIANKRGRNSAKKIMSRTMQKVTPVSIPAIYQLSELVKCEGDVFNNYKKINRAMFTEIDRIGIWKNSVITETSVLLEVKITSCIIIDFFNAVGCPEISILGCEHFLTGYPLIEEATQSEFYRSGTLLNGDDCCHFHFYRKGTAPDNEHKNK